MSNVQLKIAGTERKGIPELDELAKPFVEARYARIERQKEETRLQAQLLERMGALEVDTYVVEGATAEYEISRTESVVKLKCRKLEDGDADLMGGDE